MIGMHARLLYFGRLRVFGRPMWTRLSVASQYKMDANGPPVCAHCDRVALARFCFHVFRHAYVHRGVPMVSLHHAMPFGATASVVAWHQVGSLLQKVARQILHLPLWRYVDDFFAAERRVM